MSGDEVDKMAAMDRWLGAVCAELGVDRAVLDANKVGLLRLIKDVAHGPSRPGAPMTAFLIGLASADPSQAHATQSEGVADRVRAVSRLVESWDASA